MFKHLSKTLLTGFITLLPAVLTIYLLYWMGVSSEELLGNALRSVLPENSYFPGLGMLTGIVFVFFVGLLMNAYLVRKLFLIGEQVLYRLPLIKSVYRAFRDFFDFFSPNKEGLGQVVAVTLNGMELSYMVGGYTILVPRTELRPLQMSRDEAMRFVLTAGITGKNFD